LKRIDAVATLGEIVTGEDLVISASGNLPDDWWNHRPRGADNTFSVGTLGSVTPVALGLALALPHRRVISFDADGSVLMNLGMLCTLADQAPANLTVLIFNNGIYESAGGQRTHSGRKSDLTKLAEAAGCVNCVAVDNVEALAEATKRALTDGEFGLIDIRMEPGRTQWPPEKKKPTDGVEDKFRFIRYVEALEGIEIRARPRPR
jgi:thiamine pyrophosphate-dependent acetolactate synthase large subunit-like protein